MADLQSTEASVEEQQSSPSEIWANPELLATTRAGVEVWREVHGTESLYEVSNLGNVRSWTVGGRPILGARADTPAPKQPYVNAQQGYVYLQMSVNGKTIARTLHRVVLDAFVCERPVGMECGHYDRVKTNNALTNIRWITAKRNSDDKKRHGTMWSRPTEIRDGVTFYQCTLCAKWKAFYDFRKIKAIHSVCGRDPTCDPCRKKRDCEYAARRRAKRKACGLS